MNSRHRNPPLSFSQHSRPHSRIHRGSRSPLTPHPPNPTDLHLFLTPFKTPLSAQLLNAAGRGFLDNGVLQIHLTAGHCERPHNRLLKETHGRRSKPSFVSRVRNPFQINTGNIADQKRLPSPKSRPLAYWRGGQRAWKPIKMGETKEKGPFSRRAWLNWWDEERSKHNKKKSRQKAAGQHVRPRHTHLSRAEPWVWLLVSLEKTLRSFLVLRGGEEGGV